jgi:hypothetical protein
MTNLDAYLIAECTESWEKEFIAGIKNKNNCSGFVKAVAKKLGIPLPETANADGIVDVIEKDWKRIGSGKEAAQLAATGTFVLVVLKGSQQKPAAHNGHVAIVVSGKLYRDKYPAVWGGSIGGAQSQGNKSVGEVWSRNDRDSVAYYAYMGGALAKK